MLDDAENGIPFQKAGIYNQWTQRNIDPREIHFGWITYEEKNRFVLYAVIH